jgi:hypothetical protein
MDICGKSHQLKVQMKATSPGIENLKTSIKLNKIIDVDKEFK